MEGGLLTLKQLAERLRVCQRTVRRMVQRREFPRPMRLGRQLRWAECQVDQWMRGKLEGVQR